MTFSHALLVMLLCTLIGSYTWGMRGTIIGGERGAILPGAALALALTSAGHSLPFMETFPLIASIGAAGMYFGGSQTYGETIGFTMSEDAKVRVKGRLGLALKGATWFGVFASMLGIGLGALAGRYTLIRLIVFVTLLPVVQILGTLILNRPHKDLEKLFVTFSDKRTESWGGVLFVFLYTVIFAAVHKEGFPVAFGVIGFAFGALGFWVGNLFQTATAKETDKPLFGKLQTKGFIGSWKLMECVFGAIGGFGISAFWCIFYKPLISRYIDQIIAHSGVWTYYSDKVATILLFVWLLLFMLFILRYAVKENDSRFFKFVDQAEDPMAYVVFCYLPLFLCFTGNMQVARIYSFFAVLYLLADKIVLQGKYDIVFGKTVFYILLMLLPTAALVVQLFFGYAFNAFVTMLMYVLSYLLVFCYATFGKKDLYVKGQKAGASVLAMKDTLSWVIYAVVCSAAILLIGAFYL